MSRPIPEDLVKVLQPNIKKPIEYSHIYTFQDEQPVSSESIYVKLPYTANLYWTHFRSNWIGKGNVQFELYWREKGKNVIELKCPTHGPTGEWLPFHWPLPAVHTSDDSGFYLRVFYPQIDFAGFLQLEFLGFEELLPYNSSKLVLCDEDKDPLYMFQSYDRYHRYYYFGYPDYLALDGREEYEYIYPQSTYLKDKMPV